MSVNRDESKADIQYRRGTLDDIRAVHRMFLATFYDLMKRQGLHETGIPTESDFQWNWDMFKDLYEYLAVHAEQFWVAEQSGEIVAVARSVRDGHVRELTDFFVSPTIQSRGVGRELLQRAFPVTEGVINALIATGDVRAHARYLKSGVQHQFIMYDMSRQPEPQPVHEDLTITELTLEQNHLDLLGELDTKVLGFRRDAQHRWLLSDRRGFVYSVGGETIGYGYVGKVSGPFVLLDPDWYPQVLAHAETESANQGHEKFILIVPTPNQIVMQYCLSRGFKIAPFMMYFMASQPFGRFDKYIGTDPAFVL